MGDSVDRAWPHWAPLASDFRKGVRAIFSAFVKDPDHPEAQARVEAALAPLFEDGAVMRAMDDLYLKLEPSYYAGQDYSNEAGSTYARLVESVSRSVSAQRDPDLEDERDDAPSL